VNITPVLASAGVAGLAISLGAQSLIQDFIGGLLVALENQFSVGDVIQVGGVSGSVEQVTLRATHLRSVGGDLHIVPNGQLGVVTNMSREWSRAIVDLGVAYEEDLERAQRVLEESAATFGQDEAWAANLVEPPQVLGVNSLSDWAAVMRIMVKTHPGKQWEVGRRLRQHLLAACEREGVTLPYPRQELWLHSPKEDKAA
jgi:small conductance mechanosensitive channel